MNAQPKCRICGCTEDRACPVRHPLTGQTQGCYWVELDLCSACAGNVYNVSQMPITPATAAAMEGHVLNLQLNAAQVMMIVAQIQLAARHPNNRGPAAEFAWRWAQQLIEAAAVTGQLRFMMEAGWDETLDVATEPERRIILPGE